MSKKGGLQAQLEELREELEGSQQELQSIRKELVAVTQMAERYHEERETLRVEREALKADKANLRKVIVKLKEKLQVPTHTEEELEDLRLSTAKLRKEMEQSWTRHELELLRAVEAVR